MLPMLAEETVAKTEEESFGSKLMPPPTLCSGPTNWFNKIFLQAPLVFHSTHQFSSFSSCPRPPHPLQAQKSISAGSCPDLMQHFQLAEAQIHSDQGIPFQAAGARCSVTRPAIDAKLRHVFFTRVSIHYITGARLLWNGMTETQTRIPFQMVDAQPVDRRWAKFT